MPFTIHYRASAIAHMRDLTKAVQGRIIRKAEEQLTHQPLEETKSRKEMETNQIATWELRIGDYRVYYDVNEAEVWIAAVGMKVHNRLYIGGEEIDL